MYPAAYSNTNDAFIPVHRIPWPCAYNCHKGNPAKTSRDLRPVAPAPEPELSATINIPLLSSRLPSFSPIGQTAMQEIWSGVVF